jgi:hypothetical protein
VQEMNPMKRPPSGRLALPPLSTHRAMRMAFAAILCIYLCCAACSEPAHTKPTDYRDCLSCHRGIEKIGAVHEQDCSECHLVPEDRGAGYMSNHDRIIRNPSHPAFWKTFCLPCHEKEIKWVENSLHGSMAGIINQTRYLWGAQERAFPALYGLSGSFEPLPEPDSSLYPETTRALVDDFLRRRCLRCHIHAPGTEAQGLYRAAGCAACHMLYNDEGRYCGGDRAIDPSKGGYPVTHEMTRRIPDGQCLHCHNQNHVGGDYAGLFEHDYNRSYRSPIVDGRPAKLAYGLDYHHLSRDVHAERGLWCIDCHGAGHVMGNGTAYGYQMAVPKRSCEDCHGGFGRTAQGLAHRPEGHVNGSAPSSRGRNREGAPEKSRTSPFLSSLVSRSDGREHRVPPFQPDSTAHRVREHARVRCSACHAQWSYQDYGMSVIREDRIDGAKWHRLSQQGDPYLEKILGRAVDSGETAYPATKDRVSGRLRPGIWSVGWRFRRWEYMPLGKDDDDRYAILRPLYQYLVSYVDMLGNVPLDSAHPERGDGSGRGWAFMPYVPHTTAPFGRQCDGCHGNRWAVGLGIQEAETEDSRLTVPSPPAVNTMRLLNDRECRTLLNPSARWGRERLRALSPGE